MARQTGKCPRWENCYFLHPVMKIYNNLAKVKMCSFSPPEKCPNRGKFCPFAHTPRELVPPKDFVLYNVEVATSRSGVENMLVGSPAGPISVPLRYAMDTAGFRYWLEMKGNSGTPVRCVVCVIVLCVRACVRCVCRVCRVRRVCRTLTEC
jgi:hypothetical protein